MKLRDINTCIMSGQTSALQLQPCQFIQDFPRDQTDSPAIICSNFPDKRLPIINRPYLTENQFNCIDPIAGTNIGIKVSGLITCTANFFLSGTDNPLEFQKMYAFHNPSGKNLNGSEYVEAIKKDQGNRKNSQVLIYIPFVKTMENLTHFGYIEALNEFFSILEASNIPPKNVNLLMGYESSEIIMTMDGEFGLWISSKKNEISLYEKKISKVFLVEIFQKIREYKNFPAKKKVPEIIKMINDIVLSDNVRTKLTRQQKEIYSKIMCGLQETAIEYSEWRTERTSLSWYDRWKTSDAYKAKPYIFDEIIRFLDNISF